MTAKGTALVTGASSGIGLVYARRLAAEGYDLVLVARRGDKLRGLATELNQEHGVEVDCLAADLSSESGMAAVADHIAAHPSLTLLVNNAGIGDIALFEDVTWADAQRMLNVNVMSVTRLTHAALPGMLARDGGTIINVASGAAFSARDNGFAVYSGSKAYVVHFTEVLHEEVKNRNIRLQALVAGLTRTNLGGAEDSGFFDQFPADMVMSPQDLVDASLAGLALGEVVCLPRLENYQDWQQFVSVARRIGQGMPGNKPASRYGVK